LINSVCGSIITEQEARLMILQCGVEIWANACTYARKMSDALRNVISVALKLFIALSWHYKSDYWF